MAKKVNPDLIISKLSRKYGISTKEVEKAVTSQFKFVARVMKTGKFESVRVPFWGIFEVNPYRKQKIDELTRKKRDRGVGGGCSDEDPD